MNQPIAQLPESPLMAAIRSVYGTAATLTEFIGQHIEALLSSDDEAIEKTGKVLDEARRGFKFGYLGPIAIVAVGQLLLGNPLTAVGAVFSTAVSPVAITCAAVGAIFMGWRALEPERQVAIIETVEAGLKLGAAAVRALLDLVIEVARALFGKPQVAILREMVRAEAANFGRTLSQITGSTVDALRDLLPRTPPTPQGGKDALTEVLWGMERQELVALLRDTFGRGRDLDRLELPELRRLLDKSLSDAAAYSWPWASAPTYPETVALVAGQLKLPSSNRVHVRELERMVLFKVVELTLEKLDGQQQAELVSRVEAELKTRGVERRVALKEIVQFVKTGGVDIGGSLGGLVLAGPGLYGVAGLNFLQFVVLKGIFLTSGYFAGGAALLGFGTGSLMLAIAGWAGPVGAGLAFVYTAYSIAGPAYRKLVPAVCMIAAKRLEMQFSASPPEY